MKKLLIASRNKGKISEIKHTLADMGYEILSLNDVPGDEAKKEVEEPAMTYEGNAIIKAMTIGQRFKMLDDTGLEIDALDGRPGVNSARYADGTTEGRNKSVLEEMEDVADDKRTARFTSVIAIYNPETEKVMTCEGRIEGVINREPKGENGFGYDPIFYVPKLGKTLAEITFSEKSLYDHRARAMEKVKEFLLE
ncbi:MAG: RdgB/HAM1 family non-canonical purine NTP pyrophosphatase [Patescibacteria group bacterium]|jgi:XTP/dITP diphosphohydrolase